MDRTLLKLFINVKSVRLSDAFSFIFSGMNGVYCSRYRMNRKRDCHGFFQKPLLRYRYEGLSPSGVSVKGVRTKKSACVIEYKITTRPRTGRLLFGSPTENRTPDSALRGLRLNRLTMRPCMEIFALSLNRLTILSQFYKFCNKNKGDKPKNKTCIGRRKGNN